MSSKLKAEQHVVSETPSSIELTAYQHGPAVIRESRTVSLDKGRSTLQLDSLPLQFVPGSLTVVSATGEGKFKMISTSFRDANLSVQAILAKAVGSHVVLREDTHRGIVDHTGKLLYIVDGRTAVLQESDDARGVILVPLTNKIELTDGLPEGLSSLASLVMDVEAAARGEYALNTLYEAGGLNWRPWYEAFYDHKAGKLTRFACYVELTNESGTDFSDAGIKLIAGVNHSVNAQPKARGVRMAALESAMPMAATAGGASFDYESADVEKVGEQKMYTLPDRITLENGETQNPALLFAGDIPVTREYHLDAGYYNTRRQVREDDLPKLPVKVKLRLKNDAASNLGTALPPGQVRILEPDSSGQLQKTDSSSVRGHISRNEKFVLELGNPARDIKATRELTFQHIDPEPEKEEDDTVSEGPHPVRPPVRPTVAMPAMTMTAAVEGSGEEPTDEKVETPRFQEEERVVRLFNYGDEVAVVLVHEYIPLNAEFLHDDTGFSRFSEASQNGAFEVTVPGGDENEPGETTITYRIKWQLN